MNLIRKAVAVSTLAFIFAGGLAFAQRHDDNHDQDHHQRYVHHKEWRKGAHIRNEDWNRGERIDYRHYHLHTPPRGYEWREVDGNYVLAAIATGVIASIVAASAAH
ncbi:MAG: RcnB family protein [Acidobacteriaceae bacterium]